MLLTLEIDPNEVKALDDLKKLTGVSYEGLFNDAIGLMIWAARQRQNGRLVVSLNEARNGYKVAEMDTLDRVAKAAVAA